MIESNSHPFFFGGNNLLIGMVHLPALPGAPEHRLPIESIEENTVNDAVALAEAGFDGVMIENFGDNPFRKNRVEPHTIATMTRIAVAVRNGVEIPIGINVLRNDAFAALGIAGAVGAAFVRVNVLAGTMVTDQGVIEGEAPEVTLYRQRIAPGVAILADVHVKHARPLVDRPVREVAIETAERGGADALIVTGTGTGGQVDLQELHHVRSAVRAPVLAGSGVTPGNVREVLELCNGVIVGSSLKFDGDPRRNVDPARARAFAERARSR